MELRYFLKAEYPGWHKVATEQSTVEWKMPERNEEPINGPKTPRILVLPRWCKWAWPVLNPVFFWLLRKVFFDPKLDFPSPPERTVRPKQELPEKRLRIHRSSREEPISTSLALAPALIVGLGDTGEWTLCRLKNRLHDRDIHNIDVLKIQTIHHLNQDPIAWGGCGIEPDERIEIHQDLRPYVEETLRHDKGDETRKWVPWLEWLSQSEPLSTTHTLGNDRRKARLSLINNPENVEKILKTRIEKLKNDNSPGRIIVTGSADDAEFSGMLAEIAHICRTHDTKISVTVVVAPAIQDPEIASEYENEEKKADGKLALMRELERMILANRPFVSDRGFQSPQAGGLFERIFCLENQCQNVDEASKAVAEFLWNFLSCHEDLGPRMNRLDPLTGSVSCSCAMVDGYALPAFNLWDYVREKAMEKSIIDSWMGLTAEKGHLIVSKMSDSAKIEANVRAFWTGEDLLPYQPFFMRQTHDIRVNADIENVLYQIKDCYAEAIYDKQAIFRDKEWNSFVAYIEAWCRSVLDTRQETEYWGLPDLIMSVDRIKNDFNGASDRVCRLGGMKEFTDTVNALADIYRDFGKILSKFRSKVEMWISHLAGAQNILYVGTPEDDSQPLCDDIKKRKELARQRLEAVSEDIPQVVDMARRRFDEWYETNFQNPVGRMKFDIERKDAYRLSENSFKNLKKDRVPDDIIGILKGYFHRREYPTKESFEDAVLQWLDRDRWENWKETILKHAKTRIKFDMSLDFDGTRMDSPDIGQEVRDSFANYHQKEVLSWPDHSWLSKRSVTNPDRRFRIGKHSIIAFPTVKNGGNETDPYTVSAIALDHKEIRDALDLRTARFKNDPPFAWPEEANAERITNKIRNLPKREPMPFSPFVVDLMRDTRKLFQFMYDIAANNLVRDGEYFKLTREGAEYVLRPIDESRSEIEKFYDIVRQAVSREISSDGKKIPSSLQVPKWDVTLEDGLAQIERHDLVKGLVHLDQWNEWRDVMGVFITWGGHRQKTIHGKIH